jgi:osmotically-inducible protein OsmY
MKLDQTHSTTPGSEPNPVPRQDTTVPDERRSFLSRTTDEVAAWFGNTGALGRRQRDEAVGDQIGKGPAGDSAADARLLAEITDRLTQDAKLDASSIRVVVMAGSVTLNGSVLTAADKLAAGKDAAAAGAGHVTNNLIVS